jgi:hypothetical protein
MSAIASKPLTLSVVVGLLLTACGGPVPASSGVYQLDMVKQSDSCEPARISGAQGEVYVTIKESSIWAPKIEGDSTTRFNAVVTREVPLSSASTSDYEYRDCAGAHVNLSMEILSDQNPLEVRFKETYTGVAGCNANNPNETFAGRPDSDCSAETLLRYTLVRKCESPCSVRHIVETDGQRALACECPQ